MRVSSFLEQGVVLCRLEGVRMEEVLRELLEGVCRAAAAVPAGCVEEAMVALLKRESRGSTGLGEGVAIPHVALPSLRDFRVALGLSRPGVDFRASDERPVHVVFLVLSPPDDPYGHLRLMGLIAGLVRKSGFVDSLRRCCGADGAIALVRRAERSLFPDE